MREEGMNRSRKWISLGFGAYSVILTLAYVGFLLMNRAYITQADIGFLDGLLSAITLSFLGALLSYRRPENVISWLFILVALLRQASYIHHVVGIALIKGVEPTSWLLFIGNFWALLSGLTYTILAYIVVIFPTGRLPTRRWRPATWLLGLQAVLSLGLFLFLSYDLAQAFSRATREGVAISITQVVASGPFSLAKHVRMIPELGQAALLIAVIALVMVLLGLWSQIGRYRQGNQRVRQQIKWVIFAVALWACAIFLIFLPIGIGTTGLIFVSPIIPISIAVAILRYRIYDIDLIIRRTVVYGALTSLLLVVYFGSVTLMQSLVSTISGQESPLIIVISTLLIAALFTPLRRWVQGFIDRRFYRRKYDAEVTLAQFAETARDEVDLDELAAALLQVVQETLQPESTTIWLKK